METNKVEDLLYGQKLISSGTGEVLTYYQYCDPYILAYDAAGLTIWLLPDRVELYEAH